MRRESDGPMSTAAVVTPRDAASVMLVREPNLIYMTGRPPSLTVGPGFYVFPGGAVEEQDRAYAAKRLEELSAPGLDPAHAAFVAAAVRETFEEVGLLLAFDNEGRPLWRPDGASRHGAVLRSARNELIRGTATLLAVMEAHGWRVAGPQLGYVARWVTPPAAPRRFDTRFFIVDVTGSIEPIPHAPEVSEGCWLSAAETLARHEAGTLPLMRPTKALLQRLAGLGLAATAVRTFHDPTAEREEVIEKNTPETLSSVLTSQGVSPVPVPSPTLPPATATNVYVIAHGGEAVIVDAGWGGDAGIALVHSHLERLGRPRVKALMLTHSHPDHAGGAPHMQQAFGCPIWAHPAAQDILLSRYGVRIERELHGGETVAVGRLHLDILHAPGHAPDHLCLFVRERAVLLSGDNVVGDGSTWVGPPDGDMTEYLRSLAMLKQLPARIIAPGHGPPLDEPSAKIDALIRRRLQREEEIVALLVGGAATVEQLADALYLGKVPEKVMGMARRTVLGHLLKLKKDGRVRQLDDVRWTVQ